MWFAFECYGATTALFTGMLCRLVFIVRLLTVSGKRCVWSRRLDKVQEGAIRGNTGQHTVPGRDSQGRRHRDVATRQERHDPHLSRSLRLRRRRERDVRRLPTVAEAALHRELNRGGGARV